jgi:hypothetical protein
MSDPPTQPFSQFPKRRPVYKNSWFLIAVGLVVVVLAVIGSGVKAMSNNQNAKVAKVQLQVKADQNAAAANAAKAQADAARAAAVAREQQAAAVAKARQDAALAKAQQDAAEAKRLAEQNGNKAPIVVVPPPEWRYGYPYIPPNPGPVFFIAKVASVSTQAAAQAYVSQIEAAGYSAQVFYSSNYTHLTPGYWVVGAGPFSTFSDASAAIPSMQSIASDAYVRCVGSEASCAGQD